MAGKKQNTQANLLKFRRTPSAAGTSQDGEAIEQKFLTTDTSLGNVVTMIFLRLCRRVTIDIQTEKRLAVYFALIVFGGILSDFAPIVCKALVPAFIRTGKDSILNQYFVKIGWFWTFTFTLPFIAMTSEVMSNYVSKEQAMSNSGDEPNSKNKEGTLKSYLLKLITRDTARMVVNTIVWYISVNSFVNIEKVYGSCTVTAASRDTCVKKGGSWSGFDISGHTFLLMFSTLLMLEETSIMIGWETPFGHHLNRQNQHFEKSLKIGPSKQYLSFQKLSTFIRLNFVLITLLMFIWDFMLMQTALFYHTMIQKAAAGLWAAFSWFVLYKVVYRLSFLQAIIRPPSRPFMET